MTRLNSTEEEAFWANVDPSIEEAGLAADEQMLAELEELSQPNRLDTLDEIDQVLEASAWVHEVGRRSAPVDPEQARAAVRFEAMLERRRETNRTAGAPSNELVVGTPAWYAQASSEEQEERRRYVTGG